MKRFNISIKREMQIKTQHDNSFPRSIWQILQKTDANLCCWRCEWAHVFIHCWGMFRLMVSDKPWRNAILIAYVDMMFWITLLCLKCTNPLKLEVYFCAKSISMKNNMRRIVTGLTFPAIPHFKRNLCSHLFGWRNMGKGPWPTQSMCGNQ